MADIWDYTLGILGMFVLLMFRARLRISTMKSDAKNLSARKKIEKGQSFKEWLLLSRWKHILPKYVIVQYYVMLITFTLLGSAFLIMGVLGVSSELARKIYMPFGLFFGAYFIVFYFYYRIRHVSREEDTKYQIIFFISLILLLLLLLFNANRG